MVQSENRLFFNLTFDILKGEGERERETHTRAHTHNRKDT